MDDIVLRDDPWWYGDTNPPWYESYNDPEQGHVQITYPARIPSDSTSASATPPDLDLSSIFGSLFPVGDQGSSEGMQQLLTQYMNWVRENTDYNNAWSAEQAEKAMQYQTAERIAAEAYNTAEAAKNRDWQKMMSDTAHQREMADLKAAGLNPVLAARQGAAVTSGATASGSSAGSGKVGNGDQSANSAITSLLNGALSAMTSLANKAVDAQTSMSVAYQYTQMERIIEQMKEEYSTYEHQNWPSNIIQAVTAILDAFGVNHSSVSAGAQSVGQWFQQAQGSYNQSIGALMRRILGHGSGSGVGSGSSYQSGSGFAGRRGRF